MKRTPAALLFSGLTLLALLISLRVPSIAKAHLIAVFPLRSTPALVRDAVAITRAIAARLAALPGFDATVLAVPTTGSLGAAAATAGAESYVVGQVSDDGTDYTVTLSGFDSSNDVQRSSMKIAVSISDVLPADKDFSSLLQQPQAKPSPLSNLISGLTLGTPIDVFVDNSMSSGAAKVGQTLSFHAAHDVYTVDGAHIAIAKGAPGFGEVQSVDSAGGNGHGGKIALQFDWIAATDGTKVPLTNAQNSTEGGDAKGASSTATIASYVLLGPIGLFAHNFVRGKDAVISPTTPLVAYVDRAIRPAATGTLPPTPIISAQLGTPIPASPNSAQP